MLLPLGRKFAGPGQGVKYNIVAHIYTNYTVAKGSGSHFIARYVTPDGGQFFDYDGMTHEGHARHQRGAKLSKWLSGTSDKLNNVPKGYNLVAVIYHLEGGDNAQRIFRTERQKTAPWGLQLDADAGSDQPFARFAQLVQPHLVQMTDEDRDDWTSKKRRAQAHEYQRDEPTDERMDKAKVTDTERVPHEIITIHDDSNGERAMSGDDDTDNDSLDALILETIGEKAATQTKPSGAISTISNSSDSTSPCPINCYGCGEISDGDDDQNQVQCSHCGFWSHFKCQPENDELDWSDPAVHFTCQGCRPRTAAQPFLSGEIVMLPDPRAEDQWRDAKVLWYPARFLKHRPHAPNKKREFEFRFLQCIQWTRQEHELMQPSRHYSQDRKFCEELSKIVLRPEQIGIVRYPAFSSPNPPKNHPLIEIFDIAVASLAKLLVSFPGDHPVVRSYNAFFMDRPEDHRDTHIERWLPEGLHQPERELTALMERPL
ncbi:hypothetical protein B0H13DRAFT_2313329 [Mycena leptocephala]|nr:hypothetical protein B0H13DRAFT_2313329 [Mycena leptocephala]